MDNWFTAPIRDRGGEAGPRCNPCVVQLGIANRERVAAAELPD